MQRVGLQFVLALSQRLQRVVQEAGIGGSGSGGSGAGGAVEMEQCLANALQTYLPEFQLLINVRSRYFPI